MDLHSSIEIHFGSKAFNLVAFVSMLFMLAFQFKKPSPPHLKKRVTGGKSFTPGNFNPFYFCSRYFFGHHWPCVHSAPMEASLASLLVGFSAHKSVILDGPKSTIKKFTKLLRWNQTWIQQFQQAKKGAEWIRSRCDQMCFVMFVAFVSNYSFYSSKGS